MFFNKLKVFSLMDPDESEGQQAAEFGKPFVG